MIKFHAVMIDETGCEFGVDIDAETREEAYNIIEEDYPESRVDCLEAPSDHHRRIQSFADHDYDYDF